MESKQRHADPSVLLLHNLDPSWEVEAVRAALSAVEQLGAALEREGHSVVEAPVRHPDLTRILEPFDPNQFIVFNWCEELPGLTHSDARVTGILEEMMFTYTGSAADVLSLSWDKPAYKSLMELHGIPTPRWRVVASSPPEDWANFPAIVKPAFEHCSVGITPESVVMDRGELFSRIEFVQRQLRQQAIVEDFIDGREFHVTLPGNGQVEILPPAEMDYSAFDNPRERLCSFDSKFTPGSIPYESIEIRVPAWLNAHEKDQLRDVAVRTYQAFRCRDYGRIDLRGLNGRMYVLDVNPNPDISPDTSLALAAKAAGLTYGKVPSHLVRLAVARHPLLGTMS